MERARRDGRDDGAEGVWVLDGRHVHKPSDSIARALSVVLSAIEVPAAQLSLGVTENFARSDITPLTTLSAL